MTTCKNDGEIKTDSSRTFYTITGIECKTLFRFNTLSLAEAARYAADHSYCGDSSPATWRYSMIRVVFVKSSSILVFLTR